MKIGSLCSGYGGLEMGLQSVLGGDVAWHFEYDKHPAAILEHRFPGVPNHRDITAHNFTGLEPIDWLTAGYPCQPFSHAGKRKGSNDARHLWPDVLRAVGALRPRGVLLENVAGHVSLGLDRVLWDLAAVGYDATWSVVRASDAGAPHGRARVFIVAVDADSSALGRRGTSRQLGRMGTEGLLAHTVTDAEDDGLQRDGRARDGRARDGRPRPADRGVVAPHTAGKGPQGRGQVRDDGRKAQPADRQPLADDDDTDRWGGDEKRRQGRRDAAAGGGEGGIEWGAYGPAVRRWEHVTGRSTPRPTEPGRNGERLSPAFVEWMMGLPAGWVTDVPGLPRNAQLKALGNGVVPQQAALALRLLLPLAVAA